MQFLGTIDDIPRTFQDSEGTLPSIVTLHMSVQRNTTYNTECYDVPAYRLVKYPQTSQYNPHHYQRSPHRLFNL